MVAVTGRSMGWCLPFAGSWPIDAIVAENGAVALIPALHGGAGDLVIEYAQSAATRARNARRLRAAAAHVLHEVPGTTLAADSAGRVTDIAIDHSENARLDAGQIAAVVARLQAKGLTVSVSSIHINGWIGAHDKLSGARWIAKRLYGIDLDHEVGRWLAIGDSANDQALFAHFPVSVGVANLMDAAAAITAWPAYLTEGARGAGFAEVARCLVAAHSRP